MSQGPTITVNYHGHERTLTEGQLYRLLAFGGLIDEPPMEQASTGSKVDDIHINRALLGELCKTNDGQAFVAAYLVYATSFWVSLLQFKILSVFLCHFLWFEQPPSKEYIEALQVAFAPYEEAAAGLAAEAAEQQQQEEAARPVAEPQQQEDAARLAAEQEPKEDTAKAEPQHRFRIDGLIDLTADQLKTKRAKRDGQFVDQSRADERKPVRRRHSIGDFTSVKVDFPAWRPPIEKETDGLRKSEGANGDPDDQVNEGPQAPPTSALDESTFSAGSPLPSDVTSSLSPFDADSPLPGGQTSPFSALSPLPQVSPFSALSPQQSGSDSPFAPNSPYQAAGGSSPKPQSLLEQFNAAANAVQAEGDPQVLAAAQHFTNMFSALGGAGRGQAVPEPDRGLLSSSTSFRLFRN